MTPEQLIASDNPKHKAAIARFNQSAEYAKAISTEGLIRFAELENYIKHSGTTNDQIMKHVHDFVDWYIEGTKLKEFSVCWKNCSHCCNNPVMVLDIEAEYIANRSGKAIKPKSLTDDDKHQPCVFLKGNQCSIYQYRPIACRSFFTFDDPSECVDSHNEHVITQLDQLGPVLAAFELLVKHGHFSFLDIREWYSEIA